MSDAKSKIRKGILYNRRLLAPTVFQARNQRVIEQLIGFCQKNQVKSVHCFLPIKRNKEVDTWPLINALTDQMVQVVVSATDFEKRTMSHFEYSVTLQFENDRFGIPTPVQGTPAEMSNVDMVVIPLLAADKKGNRIGYGKGYYDRLLTEMPSNVLKVGVTLGPLFDHFSFAEPHDISLDYVITSFETVKCN